MAPPFDIIEGLMSEEMPPLETVPCNLCGSDGSRDGLRGARRPGARSRSCREVPRLRRRVADASARAVPPVFAAVRQPTGRRRQRCSPATPPATTPSTCRRWTRACARSPRTMARIDAPAARARAACSTSAPPPARFSRPRGTTAGTSPASSRTRGLRTGDGSTTACRFTSARSTTSPCRPAHSTSSRCGTSSSTRPTRSTSSDACSGC